MPPPVFKNTMAGEVGDGGIHVTVYGEDASGDYVALDPISSPVNWSGLPDAVTVTPDESGYIFTATSPGFCVARANYGAANAAFVLNFRRPRLKSAASTIPIIRATSIEFAFTLADFDSPITEGTPIGVFTVEPAEWVGGISLTGSDAGLFFVTTDAVGVDGQIHFVLFAAVPIEAARTYRIAATAKP